MYKNNEKNVVGSLMWFSLRSLINVVIIFCLVEGFLYSYQFSYQVFGDFPYAAGQSSPVSITIEEGESASEVAEALYANRIVSGKYAFLARVYLGKYAKRMKAGTYQVSARMSPDEICREICGVKSEASP